jgi:predicted transcriptional regulator
MREEARAKAEELRKAGKTQEEVAAEVGVPRETVRNWEKRRNNGRSANASPPDLRVTIPAKERPKIYRRVKKGEPIKDIAADYGTTERRIQQIVRLDWSFGIEFQGGSS